MMDARIVACLLRKAAGMENSPERVVVCILGDSHSTNTFGALVSALLGFSTTLAQSFLATPPFFHMPCGRFTLCHCILEILTCSLIVYWFSVKKLP